MPSSSPAPGYPANRLLYRWWSWWLRRHASPAPVPSIAAKGMDGPSRQALVVFHASEPGTEKLAVEVAAFLSGQGLAPELVGFFSDKKEHPEARFSHFNLKALSWQGQPGGELMDNLKRRPWQAVVGIHHGPCLPVAWLVTLLPARTSIGPYTTPQVYRLALEGHERGLKEFPAHLARIWMTLQSMEYADA